MAWRTTLASWSERSERGVVYGTDMVHVELRPFNDRQLNRDLAAVCAKVC